MLQSDQSDSRVNRSVRFVNQFNRFIGKQAVQKKCIFYKIKIQILEKCMGLEHEGE